MEALDLKDKDLRHTTIKGRVPLLLSCFTSKEKANKAMLYLQVKKVNTDEESIVKILTLQIYMKLPQSLINSWQVMKNLDELVDNTDTSEVDTISHFLLSALASTQQGRGWTDQMREFEAAARKLAATHPLLILRNLPILASGMKGRTEFDFTFFRSRNHMTFYSMALGILELTSPHLFADQYRSALEDCLDCYMSMFNNYFVRREAFSGLFDKVLAFLHAYLTYAPKEASIYIAKQRKILAQYTKTQTANSPALIELGKIVTLDTKTDDENPNVHLSGASTFLAKEDLSTQESAGKLAVSLQSALSAGDHQEILESLNVIKLCSQTHCGVLTYLSEPISSLISHDSKNVRNVAYDLYLRLLR